MLTRRGLLGVAAAAAVTAGLSACTADEPSPAPRSTTVPGLDPARWDSVRAQFALAPDVVNLASFVFASHPASVRAAIDKHRAGLDLGPVRYLGEFEGTLDDDVLAAAAAYLQTRPDQVAFTDSTTMGLGLLYAGLRLRAGDEVLTTEHDFYSTHEALRLRAVRDGVVVKRVRLYDEPESARVDDIVGRLRAGITGSTRVVAVTWVHSGTGVKLPIRAIADVIASINQARSPAERVLLCVDGVHGFAAEDSSPDQLGCDFLASGCHKWLFGPRGTGLVWGRAEAWARYTPVIPSFANGSIGPWIFGGETTATPGPAATPGGYHSFEHRWALAPAFDLHAAITRARVGARTRELADRLKAGLADLPGVRLRTPRAPELSAGIVCCEVDGVEPRVAVNRLWADKVLGSVTPYRTEYLRFGTSIVNSESDVDAAVAAVRKLR